VRDKARNVPAGAVALDVRWLLGGEVAEKQSLVSLADGSAEFWLPRPTDLLYGTLLVCVHGSGGTEMAKFHVRGQNAD